MLGRGVLLKRRKNTKIIIPNRLKPEDFLTKLVLARIRGFEDHDRKRIFELWSKSRDVKYLPEGVPFKISGHPLVESVNGTFVRGINRPFILVAKSLRADEARNVARHEYNEWLRYSDSDWQISSAEGKETHAHQQAVKRENPRLRKSASKKRSFFAFLDFR